MNKAQPRILAVIPARGGSRGLPGKNIRLLFGKPLLHYSIVLAGQLGDNVECIVSTDDSEIADVARQAGASVPFLRPPDLATDTAPMSGVLRHALETMERLSEREYDLVLLLDPTSPTRTRQNVLDAIEKLRIEPALDGVVAVSEPFFNPVWVGVRLDDDPANRIIRYFAQGEGIVRRQDVGRFLRINGSFYVWRSEFVRRLESSWLDEGSHGAIEIPETHAFSIDDEKEFQVVEAVVGAGIAPLPGFTPQSRRAE